MKLTFIWAWAFAATSVVVVAACGSVGGSTYVPGIDGGGGANYDGPQLNLEGGSGDGHGGRCNPLTCAKLGYTCGPAGDGCGSMLNCGTCKSPETCGGGGKFSQCGGKSACVPKTCADLGIDCGPAGDGCGGALSCGSCKAPETCGGGGKPSTCGKDFMSPDGSVDGGLCVPLTCADQKISCGPAGDGCGGSLACGSCTAPETCGGGGTPSMCGASAPTCKPKTCADIGFNCGPAGDGCGGLIPSCGTCASPLKCGGGGKPGVCGSGFIPPDGGLDGGDCVPLTCASQKISCGPAGDGCGDSLNCGTCTAPDTCGGAGVLGACGHPTKCAPATCASLGVNCGPVGDGCGGLLSCGSCSYPDICGGGGKPSVCGTSFVAPEGGIDGGACVPQTCASQKITCGPAGDGCGDTLACGTCTAPDTCGGGGTPGKCGHNTTCVPTTCAKLGYNCGPAGDGCGGSLSCGTCVSPNICGGGGVPGVCGDVPACTGLCADVPSCGSGTTTLSGTVVAGTVAPYLGASSPDPVPNVFVYIPNAAPAAFTDGPSCGCAPVSGAPLVGSGQFTTTDYKGNFTLTGIPVPPTGVIPLVIQLGKWRRYFSVGSAVNPPFSVTACASNSAGTIHMPRSKAEGDIPLTAVSTGNVDAMECVLLKMGVAQTEFTDPGGTGRIQLFKGNGAIIDGATPPETLLVPLAVSAAELDNYDQVIFPCWGEDPRAGGGNVKTANQQANIINYTTAGGRMFATHYSYAWLYNVAPFNTAATWINDLQYNTGTGNIVQPSAFADVNTFYQWMNALTSNGSVAGQFAISTERNDFSAAGPNTELWVNLTGAAPPIGGDPTKFPLTFTFNTPYSTATPPPAACGRVIFSDFHVTNSGGTDGVAFPGECTSGEMTAQEKSLEYLIWDLASCPPGPPPPVCIPATCASQGYNCGPQGDGCGGSLNCGTCTGCEVCGGGGKPGVCGGACCMPETCASQGIQCGPAGDGCGGTLSCGTCPPGESCGGGGVDGKCGAIDSGTCTPKTCAGLGYNCGAAGDGCGGTLNCGTCSGCQTCGGGGKPSVCGGSCCVPTTCATLGFSCGPAGDGCGGTLDCGTCPPGLSCGGAGTPGVCGAIDAGTCTPLTCAAQGFDCGPAGDGCGGSLSCGTCSGCQVCGGGGSGVCGGTCCVPETCASQGISCGPAGDGCGGTLSCGSCTLPATCGGGGKPGVCGAPDGAACMPLTCAAQGIDCGPAGDGCGGALSCGTCPMGMTCGGGGVSGKCGSPPCTPKTCTELGFNCGPAGDGCGGSLNCGMCSGGNTCGGGGTPGVCGTSTTK